MSRMCHSEIFCDEIVKAHIIFGSAAHLHSQIVEGSIVATLCAGSRHRTKRRVPTGVTTGVLTILIPLEVKGAYKVCPSNASGVGVIMDNWLTTVMSHE